MIFDFVCDCQLSGRHGHDDNTPTPLWYLFWGIFLKSEINVSERGGERIKSYAKNCLHWKHWRKSQGDGVGMYPPAERLFQGWRKMFGPALKTRDILPPPPPSKHPSAAPVYHSNDTQKFCLKHIWKGSLQNACRYIHY